MPKKPLRKLIRGNRNSLTVGALEQLLCGYPPFSGPQLTELELKAAYYANKAFIMSLVGKNLFEIVPGWLLREKPIPWGHRPAAWWTFDAPEGRRLLSGDPGLIWPNSPLWKGVPKLYVSQAGHDSLTFETEPAYLERLGLWLPNEREKVKLTM